MFNIKRSVRYSLVTMAAAVVALAIAWDAGADMQIASSSSAAAAAPDCRDAVWPYMAADCLVHEDAGAAIDPVRRILIDDNTRVERWTEIALLSQYN